jgi:RNA polymerase sigma factor (sigma-70 family)
MALRSPHDPELVSLSALARAGDIDARNRIALANEPVIIPIVVERLHRIRGRPAAGREDLIQEGFVGLLRAAELYDPSHGLEFGAYAAIWIRQQIDRAIHVAASAPAISHGAAAKAVTWRRLAREGVPEAEIVARLRLKPRMEQLVRMAMREVTASPIADASRGPEADECDPAARLMRAAAEDEMHEALSQLEPELRAVMVLRYGIGTDRPLNDSEIGGRLGLCRASISGRVRRGRERLAEYLGYERAG